MSAQGAATDTSEIRGAPEPSAATTRTPGTERLGCPLACANDDTGLSFRARGVLQFLLTRAEPDGRVTTGNLSRFGKEGEAACTTAVMELIHKGYMSQERVKFLAEGTRRIQWGTVTKVILPAPGACSAHPGTCGPASTGLAHPSTPQEPRRPLPTNSSNSNNDRSQRETSSLSSVRGGAAHLSRGWPERPQAKAATPAPPSRRAKRAKPDSPPIKLAKYFDHMARRSGSSHPEPTNITALTSRLARWANDDADGKIPLTHAQIRAMIETYWSPGYPRKTSSAPWVDLLAARADLLARVGQTRVSSEALRHQPGAFG